MLSGYTTHYVRVAVPFQPSLLNEIVPVRIEQYGAELCTGTAVSIHENEAA